MRRFSSYGPVNHKLHYYVSREELIAKAHSRLIGLNPHEGGHYITAWAPRQTGKTSAMIQLVSILKKDPRFDVIAVNLENLKNETTVGSVIETIAEEIGQGLNKPFNTIKSQKQFQKMFHRDALDKPLILVLDEFDALPEKTINALVTAFRSIYNINLYEQDKPAGQKSYRLHAVALVGVRSVLGIENEKGSPFNVQQSLHISNLTYDEVKEMFRWYKKESGQDVEERVVEQLFYETGGQAGLVSWFGELLTDTYNQDKSKTITMEDFEAVYAAALNILPNNNILNIISKAKQEPYNDTVLELFKTDKKIKFTYDDTNLNYLYMNGVIDTDKIDRDYYAKFASPFVQKRLFNYFANELFREMGQLVEPFQTLDDTITESHLNIRNLAGRYQQYLAKNRKWLLEDVPRRKDLRIYEAIYHFNFYSFVGDFLKSWNGRVIPEFPTGNGKIDLVIELGALRYGIELKSYSTERDYKDALAQAAKYGKQLGLAEISLLFFVEKIDPKSRNKYEQDHKDTASGVTVKPVFVETGN
ncbi:MAG: AAA family ATPase [bacterium]|nr:AAA family ATPase [bacterium]